MYTAGYSSGLGFAPPTATVGGVNIFDPSTYTAAFQTGGILDTSDWDWHEYALAGLAAYFVISRVFRGTRRAKETVSRKVKKVGGGFRKRRRALKTVFTG